GRARYVGDPVAVVLAENLYVARDAADLVDVEYEPLPAVSDPEAAVAPGAPLLYDEWGTNVAFLNTAGGGDIAAAFEQADRTVQLRVVNQRLAPSSLEPRACMFDFDPATGELSAWLSSQAIYRARDALSGFLGIDRSRIRVYNADVGGGFGAKTSFVGEELIAAALAIRFGRPVKWIETRSENLQAQTHGRGQVNYIEAAFTNDGRLLGLKVRTIADLGAFLAFTTAMVPNGTPYLLAGPYQVQAVDSQVVGAFTNKVPTGAYRGAGRPEATYILERTMDRIAHELSLDPAEVRRRNFIPEGAFPYTTVMGMQYESGNYQAGLKRLLELGNYTGWREKQREQREAGSSRMLGIGLSTFIENAGGAMGAARPGIPQEAATVRIRRDGTVLVQSGVATNGQGHFTLFAQITATALRIPAEKVEVCMNDSALPAFGIGTFGSRTTQISGSAVFLAAEAVREKALRVAARTLEAALTDLVMEDGHVMVRGVPARAVALGELARLVEEQPDLVEHEPANPANGVAIEGLAAWRDFVPSDATYSSAAHMAVVEVESETGEAHLLTYVAVDDCGRVLNSYLTEAQIHGGLTQGIGQALYEEVVYDQDGQLLTGTLMDYALPNAEEVPVFVTDLLETPSPRNPLGAKGVGEAGTIGAPPAVVNAVLDALAPLGVKSIDMPLKPEKIWTLVQAAQQGTLKQADTTPPPVFSAETKPQEGSRPDFA
ncbi:MAG TPA: xanthine dehydrogenase family protein molybdopterin-binding subunit, partial [Ktedonobacteraceae bacterium]|nr:xanthine dehydrogenase family protein molybdopterin-binding subunit [Ktedonobacteraceae bacterium]